MERYYTLRCCRIFEVFCGQHPKLPLLDKRPSRLGELGLGFLGAFPPTLCGLDPFSSALFQRCDAVPSPDKLVFQLPDAGLGLVVFTESPEWIFYGKIVPYCHPSFQLFHCFSPPLLRVGWPLRY